LTTITRSIPEYFSVIVWNGRELSVSGLLIWRAACTTRSRGESLSLPAIIDNSTSRDVEEKENEKSADQDRIEESAELRGGEE
jgi:hypothetical protein